MKAKILFVEDDDALRTMTRLLLEMEGYEVESVENGKLALEHFERLQPDLIVSDIAMPEMDGFQLLEAVRKLEAGSGIPFLFVSAYSEREDVSRARRLGVDDYLFKPFNTQDLLDAVEIRLSRRRAMQLVDNKDAHLQTVMMLANAIEARDAYTGGHVDRVCGYARRLAQALGWDAASLLVLEFGAILHDIGKVVVPDEILNKPDSLNSDELKIMHSHTEAGAHMLRGITHLQATIPYILSHHEHWDGSGYPRGLMGKEIPLEGRLLAIVDAYDAMTTDRPYRKSFPKTTALQRLKQSGGTHFDPIMTDIFVELMIA